MHKKTIDAFKALDTVVDPVFAKEIHENGPKLLGEGNFLQPLCVIVVGKGRERVKDAVLGFIHDALPEFASQRMVTVSEFPEELPSDPTDDGALMNSLYHEGFYSFSPQEFELPKISAEMNAAYGAQPVESKLSALIREFMRWDVDLYCVLSPMDPLAWQMLVQAVMTGHIAVVGIERQDGVPLSLENDSIKMLPGESFPVIDIDANKVYARLSDATL